MIASPRSRRRRPPISSSIASAPTSPPPSPAAPRGCRLSVSQAGYNTVLDLLAARARAVLVPFAARRETEQPLRAERLAALGAAELVRETELSAAVLSAAIERAAARPRPSLVIDTGGASRSAQVIAHMI